MSLDQFMLKHIHTQIHPCNLKGTWECRYANLHLKFRVLHSLHDQALSNSTNSFYLFCLLENISLHNPSKESLLCTQTLAQTHPPVFINFIPAKDGTASA